MSAKRQHGDSEDEYDEDLFCLSASISKTWHTSSTSAKNKNKGADDDGVCVSSAIPLSLHPYKSNDTTVQCLRRKRERSRRWRRRSLLTIFLPICVYTKHPEESTTSATRQQGTAQCLRKTMKRVRCLRKSHNNRFHDDEDGVSSPFPYPSAMIPKTTSKRKETCLRKTTRQHLFKNATHQLYVCEKNEEANFYNNDDDNVCSFIHFCLNRF